jgi:hypothetical protein
MTTINMEDLTVKQVRELAKLTCFEKPAAAPFPYKVGEQVLIRTVTMIQTGRIVSIGRDWIELCDAAWIADTKRFADTLAKGELNEVEPVPGAGKCVVGRGAIIDMFDWPHALPRKQQ